MIDKRPRRTHKKHAPLNKWASLGLALIAHFGLSLDMGLYFYSWTGPGYALAQTGQVKIILS